MSASPALLPDHLSERTVAATVAPQRPGGEKESLFPSFAFGENRLRSTACNQRTPPLVPLAPLDSPNRGRRVAFGSFVLYRAHHALRAEENPALDTAATPALPLDLPLLVYQGLGGRHRYNSDRYHRFILEFVRHA
jgi:hypothetical protein